MMRRTTFTAAALALAASFAVITEAYVTYAKWSSSSVDYYINPANQDVGALAAETAVQAGASAWHQQSSANFQFTYAGRATDTTTGYDQRNVVLFRNVANGSTIATTYYWTSNGTVVDADIIFWDGGWTFFTGSSGCSSGAYIEDVAAHEFGHALGLKHSSVTDATMYASYSRCSTQLRSLAADDIAGVRALYPATTTSNTAPVVSITAPTTGLSIGFGAALTFAGSATDQEDGNLTTSLAWSSSLDGPLGGGGTFSRVLSIGVHVITASVTDSRGVRSSKQVTATVLALGNTAPSVTISSPVNSATVAGGTAITFKGSAIDQQDGTITPKLTWRSSLDGLLGTGGSFTKVLRAGTHTIEAAVTDSGGLTALKRVSVTVTSTTAPSSIVLSGNGYKSKGLPYANLKWTGASSTKVDVYRNNVRIATTANDGAHVDAITQKGGGSYSYAICAAGTTTCSNRITITF